MNTTKTIDVDFDLTFADLYKATLAISIYVLRYLIWGIAIIAALWAICFAAGSMHYSWSYNADALAQWLMTFVIGAVPTALILIPVVAFVRVKQMLRAEGSDGKRHYVFSEAGIKIESQVANADVKWEAYRQVRETRKYFLLYAAPGFANVVPKSCFSDPDSIADFRSLVRARVRKFKLRQ